MKKRERKPAIFKRTAAVFLAAALLLGSVPPQPAILAASREQENAEERTEDSSAEAGAVNRKYTEAGSAGGSGGANDINIDTVNAVSAKSSEDACHEKAAESSDGRETEKAEGGKTEAAQDGRSEAAQDRDNERAQDGETERSQEGRSEAGKDGKDEGTQGGESGKGGNTVPVQSGSSVPNQGSKGASDKGDTQTAEEGETYSQPLQSAASSSDRPKEEKSTAEEASGRAVREDAGSETGAEKAVSPSSSGSMTGQSTAAEKAGQKKIRQAAGGGITFQTKDAESVKDGDTIYYNKAVTVIFTAEYEGEYLVSYRKNGSLIKQETSLKEPCSMTLADSSGQEQKHPVYEDFKITGEDEKGNTIVTAQEPDLKIVIDTKGPSIDYILEKNAYNAFIFSGEEVSCEVFADDGNGAGVDTGQYCYYVSEKSETQDTLKNLAESQWTKMEKIDGSYLLKQKNLSGEIYLRVRDRLGNTSYQSTGPLVHEKEAPVMNVKISDPDNTPVYTCSSEQTGGGRQKGLSACYRSLQVEVSVSEKPARKGRQGYSGIREVRWALVPPSANAEDAKKACEKLLRNDAPSSLEELYQKEQYKTSGSVIDPAQLVKKLAVKEKGYEKSGQYDLYIWAVDFCGNGEEQPLVIPVFLDVLAPVVTIRMEKGKEWEGNYYYRADPDEDSSNDENTAAITIHAAEDREEGSVRKLSAVLRGTITQSPLAKGSSPENPAAIIFTVEDLKAHFKDTEEEITITVSSADDLGNQTNCIAGDGSTGVRFAGDGGGRLTTAKFIRDASAPLVTISYAAAQGRKIYLYPEKENADAAKVRAYTAGNVNVTYAVEDAFADDSGLFWSIDGAGNSGGKLKADKKTSLSLSAAEGEEKLYECSAYGRDIAGNPASVQEFFSNETEVEAHPPTLSIKNYNPRKGCGDQDSYIPCCSIAVDKKVPEITLTYSPDTEGGSGKAVFIYDDPGDEENTDEDADSVLTAYVSGSVKVRAFLQEDKEGIDRIEDYDFERFYYINPDGKEAAWNRDSIHYLPTDQGVRSACVELSTALSDGQYRYGVYGRDKAGNKAVVTEAFAGESRLEKRFTGNQALSGKGKSNGDNYISYYTIVIDTLSPVITKVSTWALKTGGESSQGSDSPQEKDQELCPAYYEDDRTFYYNQDAVKTVLTIDEENYDGERIATDWRLDGLIDEGTGEVGDREVSFVFTQEGRYEAVSVRGTDRAGNHIKAEKNIVFSAYSGTPGENSQQGNDRQQGENPQQESLSQQGENSQQEGASQNAVVTVKEEDHGGIDDCGLEYTHVELSFARILDRQRPVAVITHILPDDTTGFLYPEAEKGSKAAMYCKNAVTLHIDVSDCCGEGDRTRPLLLDGEKLEVNTLFAAAGASFSASSAGQWARCPAGTEPLSADVKTDREGSYILSVRGTDRAGNAVLVRESIGTDPDRKAVIDREKGGYEAGEPQVQTPAPEETCFSFYKIVYDRTAPAYHLNITMPSNPENCYDSRTGIAYYGKSTAAIRAEYIVSDCNFDDRRILAGITECLSSGTDKMEELAPLWKTPDVQGMCSQKEGLTTAVFSLQVAVDRQHEGLYRFEIEGCDKAGNYLVPDSVQIQRNKSDRSADLIAKTVPRNAAMGSYWTERKAVDVTAPAGVLKVRSSRYSSDDYYEIRFEPGGNIPVKYEPFRREISACAMLSSTDASPVFISFDLRSLDKTKDASLRRNNPVTGKKGRTWCNDNTVYAVVEGEQVFYLENILIMDRAGNVCANDSGNRYALQKSGNIYLDVTSPAVSGIRDAEAPQVKIVADGRFTRHEADGERYIYRPEGACLNLKVSVHDPGGRSAGSGLQRVEVEVRAGGRLVTQKVKFSGIPYTYPRGEGDNLAPLVYDIEDARISIPTGSFAETNDITITVRAWDNSGNASVPSRDGGLLKMGIDTTAPRVEVNYHDTVEPGHGKYFRAGRSVDIVVIDRNVDNEKIHIDTNTSVPGAFSAPHANKTSDGGGEDGNDDRWIKTLVYEEDGEYTLQISGTDALGNAISGITWNGPAPNAFTIDKTKPVIRIRLPQEVSRQAGILYYDKAVTAKVEIIEHNFVENTEQGAVEVKIRASGHGGTKEPSVPNQSPFTDEGTELYASSIVFEEDGDYEVIASCTDLAGNEAAGETAADSGAGNSGGEAARSGPFTVDTIAPDIRLDPATFRVDQSSGEPLQGLEQQIYTDREFAPCVIIREANYDEEASGFEVRAFGREFQTEEMVRKEGDEKRGEYRICFRNFETDRRMDGVYKVTAQAADLAGHVSKLNFSFSVNRFGSSYAYADEPTEQKMQKYYINETREPLRVLEVSPVELKSHSVELFKDHAGRTLKEGAQYIFGPVKDVSVKGSSGEGHRVYEYVILPQAFEEEGFYDFILSSEDVAGNENSTLFFRDKGTEDHEIGQMKFPIEFQVDKSLPVNRITGLEKEREQYNADHLDFTVYPEDYQTDIKEVEVRVFEGGRSGKETKEEKEQYRHYRQIGEEEDAQKLAEEHIYPIRDVKKGIPITLQENGRWQFLEVITTDLAGNQSTDCRGADPDEDREDTRKKFLVTTNPLIRFYSCRPLFDGTIAAAVVLFVLFVFRRAEQA